MSVKPHLNKAFWGEWVCAGQGHAAMGKTPKEAYTAWVRGFMNDLRPGAGYRDLLYRGSAHSMLSAFGF